jgi:FkbM family methyltransferase
MQRAIIKVLDKKKIYRVFVKLIKLISGILGDRISSKMLANLSVDLTPIKCIKTSYGALHFFSPGSITLSRSKLFFTNEPDTLSWIDGFEDNAVFWDIGANVGVFSLYAAQVKSTRVLSFEPASINYYVLTRNIEINKMDKRISAYCIAIGDVSKIGSLNMVHTSIGGARHEFGDSKEDIIPEGESVLSKVVFHQAVMGFSIDDFISRFNSPFPNYIKIDVDGNEDRIIDGASQTINDTRLKSIHMELDTKDKESCKRIIDILEKAGLQYICKRYASESTSGKYSLIYNHTFVRKEK